MLNCNCGNVHACIDVYRHVYVDDLPFATLGIINFELEQSLYKSLVIINHIYCATDQSCLKMFEAHF